MVEVKGKNGICARIVADSINEHGDRLTTMELEFNRFILAEVNTHRMVSKNSASSRAIPVKSIIEQIRSNPAEPVHWGKNQAGMQAKEQLDVTGIERVKHLWNSAKESAIRYLEEMHAAGLHKQVGSRIVEPWYIMKTVASATEWDNVLWLRDHEDAQPEFQELASCIRQCLELSVPQKLVPFQWHLPYVKTVVIDGVAKYYSVDGEEVELQQAIRISASCCAQVSYRKLDGSTDKADDIYQKLFSGQKIHASPVEHQATPMRIAAFPDTQYVNLKALEQGSTHIRVDGTVWSGNFRGWIQNRQLIPNHTKWRD